MNKKRAVIVKIGKNKTDFAKWSYVNNLVKFALYLDKHHPEWCYMNVYDRETRVQIASFTKANRPVTHI